ncbi:hypothetical protein MNBD_PLANCTO03-1166 [hydrothermal vent metagenome]|uniref:RNA polymerase ECF-type sigma factor n=1 Tax=hydrothermal vent metagenome TaxID=652676 RepID=A0A3B1DZL8_9ZZZZ
MLTPVANDHRTDQELIEAIRTGDAAAFESLYLRHRDWAFRVARRFTPDDSLAMDAVQETFLYLHRKGRSLRLTAKLTTFLYPVLRHEAQRATRKARRHHGTTLDEAATAMETRTGLGAGPGAGPDSESLAELERGLARLPDTQREVLLMAAVDSMTHREIATALHIPLGTVKSRLHAALTALRSNGRLVEYFAN